MGIIWHMRVFLIFAYVVQSHGERELVECGFPPHVIVPHGANMRKTLICHMICIFLSIYMYTYTYTCSVAAMAAATAVAAVTAMVFRMFSWFGMFLFVLAYVLDV